MILSHIVAVTENNVIGKNGGLPWDIPEDMKFFRSMTLGKIMIMGRKTFESVGHPLPKRLNIVVTRNDNYKPDGALVCKTVEEAIELAKGYQKDYGDEVFIIGGGEIFKQTLSKVDKIYLTRIHKVIEGDSFYPNLSEDFKKVFENPRKGPIDFTFMTFEKNRN